MGSRVQLQALLENLLGSKNVYFQRPPSHQMSYPCIKYSLKSVDTKFANDKPYNHQVEYVVTVIDANPDSLLLGKIASLPMCKFDRYYPADNLNHYIYNLYY